MKILRNCLLGATALAGASFGLSGQAMAQPQLIDMSAMGKQMADSGIYWNIGYFDTLASLTSGGAQTGTSNIGHLFAGSILDLETMFGIKGASWHTTFEERSGVPLNGGGNMSATNYGFQEDAGPIAIRLTEFYWEQGIDNDRIDVKVGRIEPTLEFALSTVACDFVGGIICAQPGSWYYSNRNGAYPASEWGGRVNIAITKEVYLKFGAFQETPDNTAEGDHGFTWRTDHTTGVLLPVELAYQTGWDQQLPVKYTVGGYLETAGGYGGSTNPSHSAFWLQGEQTLWRPDMKTHQSLMAIAGGIFYDNKTPFKNELYAGLVMRAPLGDLRPSDELLLLAGRYEINNGNAPFGAGGNRPAEYMFELSYAAQIAQGLQVQPFLQYAANPVIWNTSVTPNKPYGNDVVIGARVFVYLNTLLNLPIWAPH